MKPVNQVFEILCNAGPISLLVEVEFFEGLFEVLNGKF